MNEQLSVVLEGQIEGKITSILNQIIIEQGLPYNSLYLYNNLSNKGVNKGSTITKSICIYEPEYPSIHENNKQGKNSIIMNISIMGKIDLRIKEDQYKKVDAPVSAEVKKNISDKGFIHILFDLYDDNIFKYIIHSVEYCLKEYESSNHFGCCSRFVECSDAKRCLHENTLYSKGCAYRSNLEAGRIFYGINKNCK